MSGDVAVDPATSEALLDFTRSQELKAMLDEFDVVDVEVRRELRGKSREKGRQKSQKNVAKRERKRERERKKKPVVLIVDSTAGWLTFFPSWRLFFLANLAIFFSHWRFVFLRLWQPARPLTVLHSASLPQRCAVVTSTAGVSWVQVSLLVVAGTVGVVAVVAAVATCCLHTK